MPTYKAQILFRSNSPDATGGHEMRKVDSFLTTAAASSSVSITRISKHTFGRKLQICTAGDSTAYLWTMCKWGSWVSFSRVLISPSRHRDADASIAAKNFMVTGKSGG